MIGNTKLVKVVQLALMNLSGVEVVFKVGDVKLVVNTGPTYARYIVRNSDGEFGSFQTAEEAVDEFLKRTQ